MDKECFSNIIKIINKDKFRLLNNNCSNVINCIVYKVEPDKNNAYTQF